MQQQFQNQQTLVSYYTVLLTIVCFYLLYQLGTEGKACTRCLPRDREPRRKLLTNVKRDKYIEGVLRKSIPSLTLICMPLGYWPSATLHWTIVEAEVQPITMVPIT